MRRSTEDSLLYDTLLTHSARVTSFPPLRLPCKPETGIISGRLLDDRVLALGELCNGPMVLTQVTPL